MKDDLQVHLTATCNVISDETGKQGAVTYQFGVNKVPTKVEMDEVVKDCIRQFNEAAGSKDARLVTLEDFGFASTQNMEWQFDSVAAEEEA